MKFNQVDLAHLAQVSIKFITLRAICRATPSWLKFRTTWYSACRIAYFLTGHKIATKYFFSILKILPYDNTKSW